MRKRIMKVFQAFVAVSMMLLFGSFTTIPVESACGKEISYEKEPMRGPLTHMEFVQPEPEVLKVEELVIEEAEKSTLTQEEIELIALVTMAEAEAEPVEGQRLVIDTILNRVDSEHFPDTVHEVIYQPNQFTSMWNGRLGRCYIREDLVQLVKEEAESRYNSEVVFFRTGRYSDYGDPLFKVGHHYFSRY